MSKFSRISQNFPSHYSLWLKNWRGHAQWQNINQCMIARGFGQLGNSQLCDCSAYCYWYVRGSNNQCGCCSFSGFLHHSMLNMSVSPSISYLHDEVDDSDKKCLWVFAYGSLCWKPGIKYKKSVKGHISGYSRKFWQGNTTHRGTDENVSFEPAFCITLRSTI